MSIRNRLKLGSIIKKTGDRIVRLINDSKIVTDEFELEFSCMYTKKSITT